VKAFADKGKARESASSAFFMISLVSCCLKVSIQCLPDSGAR
jgi:hypothetical protein